MYSCEEFPDTSRVKENKIVFRKDRHLSSALIITEIEYMLENRNNERALKTEHRLLISHLDEQGLAVTHPELFYSWCMLEALGESRVHTTNIAEYHATLQAATLAYKLAQSDWTHEEREYVALKPTELLVKIYDRKTQMDNLFDEITYDTRFKAEWAVWGIRGVAYGNLHLVYHKEGSAFVITHAHLAGIRDMIASWFDVLMYAQLSNTKYKGTSLYNEVELCISHVVSYASFYPVDVYTLMKMWPSLCIGVILRDNEDYTVFLDALTPDIPHTDHPLVRWMLRRMFAPSQVHLGLELSGLWKIFGHPIIDMECSINSWIEKGTVMKLDKRQMGEKCSNMFKLTLCRRYYEERHRWPPLLFTGEEAPHIKRSYTRGTWDETPREPWRSRDFQGVRFSQAFEFNMYVDPSDLLSDKSIIPTRRHWVYEYDNQAHRTLYGCFMTRPEFASKSVIISYLSKEEVDVSEIINQINTGRVPVDWKVIIAVAKEREHKRTNARFYAKMTPEMRLYQIATEGNIAEVIFHYIKEQSMTMGEEQLLRTITRMTSPHTDPTKAKYKFVVIDFSSWCTNFRWEFSQAIFRDLDDLFGFDQVYQYTHWFHLTSILMFQDRFSPPRQSLTGDPVPGKRCVYGPEAWQEGLRQKGWTLITIMLIALAAETCGTTASLLGQGDNQVVLLKIPPADLLAREEQDERSYVNNFVSVLTRYAHDAGIPIKPLETWQATKLFEYSRKYHYEGAQVSCALKKISRLASEANQVIPTVNGDLSGLYSTGASAAAEDLTPGCAYVTAVFEAMHLLRRSMPWLREKSLGHSIVLATNTRTLGGFPVTSYPNFCMRAVQDPLTTGLHWLRTLLSRGATGSAAEELVVMTRKARMDYESLVKDPTSLPLATPLQPEHYLRDMIKTHLPNLIKNKAVKNLFDITAEEQKERLISTLTRVKPFNPRLANKLYSLSNFGLQEKYISKFTGARSIQQATITAWENETEVIQSVKTVEEANSSVLKSRSGSHLLRDLYLSRPTCMTDTAQLLREEMWGLPMEGITMPSQQEQTRLYRWEEIPIQWASRAILVMVDASVEDDPLTTRGRHTPYYGSATKMRVRRAPMQVLEVGNVVSSLKQLMEIKGWVKGDAAMQQLIEALIQEKTTIPIEALEMYTRQVYSGAISHRLPCQALKRGGMTNQNLNFSSHIRILSDTALHYAKSGTNYTICFQSAFLYAISTLAQYQEMGIHIEGKWGLVFHQPCCVKEIPTEQFTLDKSDYSGVELQNRIDRLRPKYEVARTVQDSVVDGITSYSVIMARKFTLWIRNIELSTRISTLENRAVHESLTAPFVNLTEFVHLNCRQFFLSLIYYHFLYSRATRYNPQLMWVPLLIGGPLKSAYDVLCDSLIKCGLLRPWMEITGRRLTSESSREGLRCLLVQTLANLCDRGWKHIVIEHTILTHDDTEAIYVAASRLLHDAHEVYWPYARSTSYEQIRELLLEEGNPELLPACTTSEEEAVCTVRASEAPAHHRYRPTDTYYHSDVSAYATGSYVRLYNQIAGCVGFSVLHTSLYLLFSSDFRDAWREWLSGKNVHLYTFDDVEGSQYTFLSHLLTCLWGKRVKGYPHWQISDDEVELVINEGPTCVAMDECKLSYDLLRFQASMTGRMAYKCDPRSTLYVVTTRYTRWQELTMWPLIPLGCMVIIEHDTRRPFPPVRVYRMVRVLVRTGHSKVWIVGRKQDVFSWSNSEGHIEGPAPDTGFGSIREAMSYVRESLEPILGCYSIDSWLKTRLQISCMQRAGLEQAIEQEYLRVYSTLMKLVPYDQANSGGAGLKKTARDLAYWSWVAMCGREGPERMASRVWTLTSHVRLHRASYCVCHCTGRRCGVWGEPLCNISTICRDQWMWYAAWRKVGPNENTHTDVNYMRFEPEETHIDPEAEEGRGAGHD